jgi:hypothetical protein
VVLAIEDISCVTDLLLVSGYSHVPGVTHSFNNSIVHWLDVSVFLECFQLNLLRRQSSSSGLPSAPTTEQDQVLTPYSLIIRYTLTASSQESPQSAQVRLVVFSIQASDDHICPTLGIFPITFTHRDERLAGMCVTTISTRHLSQKGHTALKQ